MRQRLSAKFRISTKISGTIVLFVGLVILTLKSGILPPIPFILYSVYALLAFAAYKLFGYFLSRMEKPVVEFDQEYLYVTNLDMCYEETIPLSRITRLNMRPESFKSGNYWFYEHSITYGDEFNVEARIVFYIFTREKSLKQFIKLVKEKNPAFNYKNWTHTLDLSE